MGFRKFADAESYEALKVSGSLTPDQIRETLDMVTNQREIAERRQPRDVAGAEPNNDAQIERFRAKEERLKAMLAEAEGSQ